ncbi:MAG: CtsR family transcriptional regulator [Bacillota bacterium]|nr:CtsR family transcriptional regulator [Bacillota bacterium]
MPSLSELIERYIQGLFERLGQSTVELRRHELAERFGCAPSQINYVLETRFTAERGYLVESRRGGGGYIRIMRLQVSRPGLACAIQEHIGDQLTPREVDHLLERLSGAGLLSADQAGLVRRAIARETRSIAPPVGDVLRAMLLRAILCVLLIDRDSGGEV